MKEILPGLHHWTAHHDGIDSEVSSHYLEPSSTLIDPMEPPGGLEAFQGREPARIVLSCRHHARHSHRFVEAFGCTVHANEAGLHEFEGSGLEVEGFTPGDVLAPGVQALELGEIAPDDTVLALDAGGGALLFADGLVTMDGGLGFVPDFLIGDDPEGVKQRTVARLLPLAERDPEALLFAHGNPIVGHGGRLLREFAEGARR